MIDWKKYAPYFKEDEFKCKCCGKVIVDETFLDMLLEARKRDNVPFIINSGYRCPTNNKAVGGKADSDHLKGKGVDIKATDSKTRFAVVRSAINTGFNRIGISKSFVHLGYNEDNPQNVIWLY